MYVCYSAIERVHLQLSKLLLANFLDLFSKNQHRHQASIYSKKNGVRPATVRLITVTCSTTGWRISATPVVSMPCIGLRVRSGHRVGRCRCRKPLQKRAPNMRSSGVSDLVRLDFLKYEGRRDENVGGGHHSHFSYSIVKSCSHQSASRNTCDSVLHF